MNGHIGATGSNPLDDPNPRLEAYLAAARRGAAVWLLLDAYFDSRTDPVSNHATCQRVNSVARAERLKLYCALGNPAGLVPQQRDFEGLFFLEYGQSPR